MINPTYILLLTDPSYARRQLRALFWGESWRRPQGRSDF